MDFDLSPAEPSERAALENLFQLYTHDFSEFWAGRREGELQDDGRFAPYPLDSYWTEHGRVPLLLRAHGHLAGFVLLNRSAHGGRPLDWSVAEFFVVRKHRRSGLGLRAAHEVFSRYPGQWEAAVARRNVAALAFWRKAVASHPRVSAVEEIDADGPDWDGPILRFRIG